MRTNESELYAQVAVGAPVKRASLQELPVLRAITSIQAERQRVFKAITLPEYMEAWLNIPGASLGCAVVTAGHNSFSICCSGQQTRSFTILCTYRACKRSRLLFDWKYEAQSITSESLVSIRLLGDFERTTLELVHFGLPESLMRWHRELWDASLAQLSRLF